jgi:murein DD-endopeptidase MepM/ murein hydrolase activator NlpD
MMTPQPPTRDPAAVLAAVAGLFAAGALLAFVYAAASPAGTAAPGPVVARAASAAPTAAGPTIASRTVIPPTAAPTRALPSATTAATPTATVTATATLTDTVAAVPAPVGSSASARVRAIQPPAPFFQFRRPFGPENAVEPSRYYPYGTTGRGEYLLHHGVDLGNPMGARVLAVGDGEVTYAGDDVQRLWGPQPDFYGRVVVIRHPATLEGLPLYSLYGHLSAVKVAAGQAVRAGDLIGLVGMAGIALGPHLHLEFRVDPADYESTRNAELFLAPLSGRGTIIGRVAGAEGAPVAEARVTLFRHEAGTDAYVAETTTYPGRHVHATAELGENFLFADIPAGSYTVATQGRGVQASTPVTVTDGAAVFVDLTP